MPCDHTGPIDLMQMAEDWLRERKVAPARWPGSKFRFGENTPGGMWASVVLEIERRADEWIVTRIDRNQEQLMDSETGLQIIAAPQTD